MVGKLTSNDKASCSQVATIMGFNKYKSPNEQLLETLSYIDGEPKKNIQSRIMRAGDFLEPALIAEAARELGFTDVTANIETKVVHPLLPLEGSLDGIATFNEDVTQTEEFGIYCPEGPVICEGSGVLEVKATSVHPEDELLPSRGVLQAKALMECTGLNWCCIIVLYQSVYLRYFFYQKDNSFAKDLEFAIIDFQERVDNREMYPPQDGKDVSLLFPEVESQEAIDLEEQAIHEINMINNAKEFITYWQDEKDRSETKLKNMMGVNQHGVIDNYQLTWGMRNYKAQPEKIIEAKEPRSIRGPLQIKEIKNEA